MDPPSLNVPSYPLGVRSYGGQAANLSSNEVARRGRKKPSTDERRFTQMKRRIGEPIALEPSDAFLRTKL